MKIEWLIDCEDIQRPHDGLFTLVGIGQRGFMLQEGHVGVARTAVMVCLLIEDDDQPGDEDELWHQVIGREGTPITPIRRTVVRWTPGDSTQKVDPERYYIPLRIQFDVDGEGAYTLEIGTLTETKEMSMWVQELPSPE